MPMKNPVHPGRIVRADCLEPLGLSVTAAARVLEVTRQALNKVVNERSSISAEMAIRLSKAFGSTPETWVRMQAVYDLAPALKGESKIRAARYEPRSGCKGGYLTWLRDVEQEKRGSGKRSRPVLPSSAVPPGSAGV